MFSEAGIHWLAILHIICVTCIRALFIESRLLQSMLWITWFRSGSFVIFKCVFTIPLIFHTIAIFVRFKSVFDNKEKCKGAWSLHSVNLPTVNSWIQWKLCSPVTKKSITDAPFLEAYVYLSVWPILPSTQSNNYQSSALITQPRRCPYKKFDSKPKA